MCVGDKHVEQAREHASAENCDWYIALRVSCLFTQCGCALEARKRKNAENECISYPGPCVEIGRPAETYRRVRIESKFGRLTVLVTDGHLPYPYGRETTGYEVTNLADTLAKAKSADVKILVPRYQTEERDAVVVQFPGGYIAEIHSIRGKLN